MKLILFTRARSLSQMGVLVAYFYKDGRLKVGTEAACADVETLALSVRPKPVYIYDLDDVELRYRTMEAALKGARNTIHYAMKANSHDGILKRLASLGAGVDTVSGGEIRRALEAEIPADRIIFSGVAKTIDEIEFALHSKIKQINVESPQELRRISEVAARLGVCANVAFRLNPDVSPKTHPYITTGFRDNKFGMDESFVPELISILKASPQALRLRGLTMHIGSLLFDLAVIREAIEKTIKVHKRFLQEGFKLDRLDVGGGLGINYETDDTREEFSLMEQYGRMVLEATAGLDVELLTEPGRILVGRSGLLVGEVQYIKPTSAKTFVILDTGMHHLIRPALYGAKHRMLAVLPAKLETKTYDVVGPICESSDFLGKNVELPTLAPGDLLAIADAGAYGYAMASRYNSHELPEEVLVTDGRAI